MGCRVRGSPELDQIHQALPELHIPAQVLGGVGARLFPADLDLQDAVRTHGLDPPEDLQGQPGPLLNGLSAVLVRPAVPPGQGAAQERSAVGHMDVHHVHPQGGVVRGGPGEPVRQFLQHLQRDVADVPSPGLRVGNAHAAKGAVAVNGRGHPGVEDPVVPERQIHTLGVGLLCGQAVVGLGHLALLLVVHLKGTGRHLHRPGMGIGQDHRRQRHDGGACRGHIAHIGQRRGHGFLVLHAHREGRNGPGHGKTVFQHPPMDDHGGEDIRIMLHGKPPFSVSILRSRK